MKKLIYISTALIALFSTTTVSAKIWRVNNNTGINADFNNLSTAVTSGTVVNGDTIHVEPSATGYGNISINKRLTIIGSGYYLSGTGANTGLQANTNTSSAYYIIFNAGSYGSVVEGMTLSYIYTYDKQITIRRNYVSYIYLYGGTDSITVAQNWIYYMVDQATINAKQIKVYNNFFTYYLNVTTANVFVENNTFTSGAAINCNNSQIDNNIFETGSVTASNNVIFNNIALNNSSLPVGNGNINNVASSAVFLQTGSTDGYYKLKAACAASGTGFGGVDMGAFGNLNPYVLSGIPDVPTIYQLTVPSVGTSTLNITISTRSNN